MNEADTHLQHFVDRILRIDPSMGNLFGTGFPGLQGSTAILGPTGSSAEVIGKLRRATMAFAHAYRQDSPERSHLIKAGEYVEAPLTILQTISILTPEEIDSILGEMHNLIDYRTPAA